jgi:hypothetical protein
MPLASHWPPGAVPVAVTAWGINAPASRQGQSEAIAGVDRCRPAVHRAATSAEPSRRIRREPRRFPLLHAAQAPRCSPVQVLPRLRVKPCSGRRSRTAPPGASALLPLTTAPPSSIASACLLLSPGSCPSAAVSWSLPERSYVATPPVCATPPP